MFELQTTRNDGRCSKEMARQCILALSKANLKHCHHALSHIQPGIQTFPWTSCQDSLPFPQRHLFCTY